MGDTCEKRADSYSVLVYINLLSAPTEHARVIGLLGMGFAVGLIAGPLIGGAFAANQHATWRWVRCEIPLRCDCVRSIHQDLAWTDIPLRLSTSVCRMPPS